ncbi:sn-glycerol-3-phosphate ABC transporter permease UgpE [Novispirillum itersonii]|uniref:sn-glycerol-3-phosphate transport system permease protein UgpE n=1 Tax=Novispirillum itersonii TaxID=189 RepID=A0A7W9ZDT9_NOVIT|nr:sn-glycerol-3-phosphate ABC transporter permease UgpE [Novispirillum itersonii]MBB6209677.1 sn-glycerol 3-phosphate transport system permease protein [Novispirillum itersonii]
MVENRPWLTVIAHVVLLLGLLVTAFPVWLTFVASTHEGTALTQFPMPLWPGRNLLENYGTILFSGAKAAGGQPVLLMLANSLIVALGIAVGKIAISIIAAYAIVYFRFPLRQTFFWMIFMTLMLPVEVRIMPTFEITASIGLLNTYGGLIIPLIASATATFLFRQFFLTIPVELVEAARLDGAGPIRFFRDILLPLSRTNIAALFVILFIYGWNQYLWPLVVTTDPSLTTIMTGINALVRVPDSEPQWHLLMAMSMLAMLPPILVVVVMQKLFVRGLVETEK